MARMDMKTALVAFCLHFALALESLSAADAPPPHWRIIEAAGGTEELIVAPYSIEDFGVDKTGSVDAAPKFKQALDAIAKLGGGVLWVPEGTYMFKSGLAIPAGVCVRGEWRAPSGDGKTAGSIFKVCFGSGGDAGEPFIFLNQSSGVNGLVVWYPEQDAKSPVPYPPSFRGASGSLENVTLINSYRGYDSALGGNSLYFLRNIYGTALACGIEIDAAYDIGRIENIRLSPDYWANSGLPGSPALDGPHRAWMRSNGVGIIMRRNDWSYLYDVSIDGFNVGFKALQSLSDEAKKHHALEWANGQNYLLKISNCHTGLSIDNTADVGIQFTRTSMERVENGVVCSPSFNGKLQLLNATIAASNYALHCQGNGAIALQGSRIEAGEALFDAGVPLLANCRFSNKPPQLEIAPGATKGSIAGCHFGNAMEPRFAPAPELKVGNSPFEIAELPDYKYRKPKTMRPGGNEIFNVSLSPYNAAGDGKSDDSSTIQKALNAAGARNGGIVFLKPGEYRVASPLNIPSGVELRGSFDIPHRAEPKGSLILVDAGKGEEHGTPFITLQANSGVRGLNFHYPCQSFDNVTPYPFMICGAGKGVYAINVTATAVYQMIDLASKRCDDHYIDYAAGAPLKAGIAVGGSSSGGMIYNCQFNPSYYTFTRTYPNSIPRNKSWGDNAMKIIDYEWANNVAFDFSDCQGEIAHQNFVFGAKYGLYLHESGGKPACVQTLGHGSDQSRLAAFIDGAPAGTAFINSQLVTVARIPGEKAYIMTGENQKAKVDFFAVSMWGASGSGVILRGGELEMQCGVMRGIAASAFMAEGGSGRIATTMVENADALAAGQRSALAFAASQTLDAYELPEGVSELSISLGKQIESKGLACQAQGGECLNVPVERAGRQGWQSKPVESSPSAMRKIYLKVLCREFAKGRMPNQVLELDYFDEGDATVKVVYDASSGPWKPAGEFKLDGSGKWRTARIEIRDALFASRCNGFDLRLETTPGTDFILGGARLKRK